MSTCTAVRKFCDGMWQGSPRCILTTPMGMTKHRSHGGAMQQPPRRQARPLPCHPLPGGADDDPLCAHVGPWLTPCTPSCQDTTDAARARRGHGRTPALRVVAREALCQPWMVCWGWDVFRETPMDDAQSPDTLLSQSLAVLRHCVPSLETAAARAPTSSCPIARCRVATCGCASGPTRSRSATPARATARSSATLR